MFKRSKGYFLLTMLVLTGLAGRSHTENLSAKERRLLLTDLKLTRSQILDNFKNFSKKQLDFNGPEKNSLRNVLYTLTATQTFLWNKLEPSLHQSALTSKANAGITDEKLQAWMKTDLKSTRFLYPGNFKFMSADAALKEFKKNNNALIRCVRTATGNLKGNVIKTPAGNLNTLQTITLIDSYLGYALQQVNRIKQAPGFPL